MKALVFNEPWDMSVADLPDPTPGEGDVLIKVDVVGICGSDVHGFTGESGRRAPGMVMGHEVAGTVVECGQGATKLNVGDRVTLYNIVPGKRQPDGRPLVIGVNAGTWGAMAEYLVCPEACLFPIDPSIDPAIALLAEPIGIAFHATSVAGVKPGDVAAVVGSGTIGIALTIVLSSLNAKRICALDRDDQKLALIATFGAEPHNVNNLDLGDIADVAFEAVGSPVTVKQAFDLTRIGGTLTLIGNLAKEFTLPLQEVVQRELVIRGSYGFTLDDFGRAVDLVSRESEKLKVLITGDCTLEDTPRVMTELAKGERKAVKMVIRV